MSLFSRIMENKHQEQLGAWRRAVQRPPWTDEATIRKYCTSCGDCIDACPESILFSGVAGTPVLSFNSGQCTFCSACAEVCAEPVFRDATEVPWDLTATLGDACLLFSGVSCRSCIDVCDEEALHFELRAGSVGAITVDSNACTGCGACVYICPTAAITLKSNS